MNDRPTAVELIAAVRQFLEGDLIPTLADPRRRFQALVAANVLAVAERELNSEEAHLSAEWRWLAGLLGLPGPAPGRLAELRQAVRAANAALCERIRAGDFDDADLARQLRPFVERKLEVANPRHLAARHAAAQPHASGG
ncbi:MAG TPA: DUF6285 domain-containing protein [Gemmataceae bacterium]|nr:DUF6285 domain-containing protein [Gemmataceae bacterium]